MVINAVLTLGTHAVLARMLDPAALGAYFLAFSIVRVASQTGQLGLDRGSVRMVAESEAAGDHAQTSATIKTVLALGLAGGLAIVIIGLPLGNAVLFDRVFDTLDIGPVLLAIALWIVASTLRELVAETFRGFHEIPRATLFGGLVTGTICLAAFVAMWTTGVGSDVYDVIRVTSVASLFVCGLALWQLASQHHWERKGPFRDFREVLAISLPLLVTGLAMVVTREAHLWILASFESERETAVFGVLSRLLILITMPQLLLNRVMAPAIASLSATGNRQRLERLLQMGAVFNGIPAFVTVLVCVVFGRELLGLLYGSYYGEHGHTALALASVGHFINVMSGMAGALLMMTGHERAVMVATVSSGVLAAGATFLFVAKMGLGINGAAMGFALGIAITNVALWAYAWKKTSIRTEFSVHGLMQAVEIVRGELRRGRR
jgi:O-antigen/teichoic acid export membrane protein